MNAIMSGVAATIRISASGKLTGGIPALFAGYLLRIVYLLPMVFLWRSLAEGGADLGAFSLGCLLTYTCVSTILRSQLNVQSGAVTWHYEGQILDLYRRPGTIFGQLVVSTVGGWLPELALFSLPLALIVPLFGVNIIPASIWFFPCLALSISLGFAVDFLFVCFIIRMKNANWMAYSLRHAVIMLLSGAVIPFDLLPWGMGKILKFLPFGSLAAAPLAVFTGMADFSGVILPQIFWNTVLWPLAVLAFRGSREKMVSYGG
jgi:ABC-2 type transport system permease protein